MSAPSIEPLVAREEWRPVILETLKQGGVIDPAYASHVERWLEQNGSVGSCDWSCR